MSSADASLLEYKEWFSEVTVRTSQNSVLIDFQKKNILLITCTRFEKNLIFHNFFVLTDKMILQIVLLTKLDDEQLNNICKLFKANSCLITHETQKKNENLIFNIIKNKYMHMFFDFEQTSIKIF